MEFHCDCCGSTGCIECSGGEVLSYTCVCGRKLFPAPPLQTLMEADNVRLRAALIEYGAADVPDMVASLHTLMAAVEERWRIEVEKLRAELAERERSKAWRL